MRYTNCCGKLRAVLGGFILPPGGEAGAFLESDLTASSWTLPDVALVGDTGKVLTASGADAAAFAAAPALTATAAWHYAFGAQQVNTGTQFLFPFFSTSAATNPASAAVVAIVQFAGTLKTLYVTHGSPTGADNIVYTVMKNGVATTLTVTLNSGAAGPASDLVNTVAVVAGDKLTLRCTGATVNRQCRPRIQFLLT